MKPWKILSTITAIWLVFVLTACGQSSVSENPVPPTATPEPPKIKLDLEFESEDDLNWMNLISNQGSPSTSPNSALSAGTLKLSKENHFFAAGLQYSLEPNHFVHLRVRPSQGQVCYGVGLEYSDTPNQSQSIGLDACTNNAYNAGAVFNLDHFGNSIFAQLPLSGTVLANQDAWNDLILWLPPGSDQLYLLVSDPDDPAFIMYGATSLPEDWQVNRWNVSITAYFDDSTDATPQTALDIDFIRIGQGPLVNYLYHSVPAYLENQDELNSFFSQTPAPLPELRGPQDAAQEMPATASEESEDTGEQAQDNTQGAAPTETQNDAQALTWPDPISILPYLVTLDDLERCNGCAHTRYGVELSPFGYIFSAAFGTPDLGDFAPESYILHSIQLFDTPINADELFEYYRERGRFQTYNAGEPIPFIFNNSGLESNHILFKSNLFTIPPACNRVPEIRELLGLPADREVYASLTLGYPKYIYHTAPPHKLAEVRYLE